MVLIDLLRHLFIPHHTNNHRAKVLHVDALLTYVLLFAVFNLGVRILHKNVPDVLGYATDIHVEQLLSDTNAKRQEAGLGSVTLNAQLSSAAAAKAADMFAKNYWAHNSPTGATPWEFISGAGYKYTVAGENLAKNFSTSQGVVDAWMASPSHKANLLKPSYKEIGFAVVNGVLNGEETTLVVQMFGASAGAPIAVITPTAVPKPVVVPEVAASEVNQAPQKEAQPVVQVPQLSAVNGYQDVIRQPIFNIPTISRDVMFAFIGIMMGVLLIDAWIVSRKHVVRVAGHNIAHMLFLGALFILVSSVSGGSLL